MLSIHCNHIQYDLQVYPVCVLLHIQVYQLTLKKEKKKKHTKAQLANQIERK